MCHCPMCSLLLKSDDSQDSSNVVLFIAIPNLNGTRLKGRAYTYPVFRRFVVYTVHPLSNDQHKICTTG